MRKSFLDGLRGWAALMVVFSHLMPSLLTKLTPAYDHDAFRFISDGNLAVYIFFVLSGFALSSKFTETRDIQVLTRLATARYFRLTIPILAASTLGYLAMKGGLMVNVEAATAMDSEDWLATFYRFEPSLPWLLQFSFYDVLANYNGLVSFNPALWTMPVEFIGSFLLLGYCALFGRQADGHGAIQVLPLAAATVLLLISAPAYAAFFIGYFYAELFGRTRFREHALVRTLALPLALLPIVLSTWYRAESEAGTVATAALAVFAVTFSPWLRTLFSNPLSERLGKISFPLYLVHFVVVCSWTPFVYVWLLAHDASALTSANLTLISSLALSLLVAWLFLPVERFSTQASRVLAERVLAVRVR